MSNDSIWQQLRDNCNCLYKVSDAYEDLGLCMFCKAAERGAALEALLREAPVPYSYDEQGMWDQHPAYIHWFYRVQEALQDE